VSLGDAVALLRGGIIEVVILAAPLLISALVVGLVIAILQATTSIQEQTLTFVPKIAVILIVLALMGGWMFSRMGDFTSNLFRMIPDIAN
jgi:flagellar biosynthetic protein FliQ